MQSCKHEKAQLTFLLSEASIRRLFKIARNWWVWLLCYLNRFLGVFWRFSQLPGRAIKLGGLCKLLPALINSLEKLMVREKNKDSFVLWVCNLTLQSHSGKITGTSESGASSCSIFSLISFYLSIHPWTHHSSMVKVLAIRSGYQYRHLIPTHVWAQMQHTSSVTEIKRTDRYRDMSWAVGGAAVSISEGTGEQGSVNTLSHT